MSTREEWQIAHATLIAAGFGEERVRKLLVDQPKETIDSVSSVPRNDFEALHAFQKLMWAKLMENRHKGGWIHLSCEFLFSRLEDEVKELSDVLEEIRTTNSSPHVMHVLRAKAGRECADVSNFSMFIADVLGQLDYKRSG